MLQSLGGLNSSSGWPEAFDNTSSRVPLSYGDIFVNFDNGLRSPTTERRFKRLTDGDQFPGWVSFNFAQSVPYGFKVENGPLDDTVFDNQMNTYGANGQQGVIGDSSADEFVLGRAFELLNFFYSANSFVDFIFPVNPSTGYSDVTFGDRAAFIQKFYDKGHLVGPGQARVIIQYYHTSWGYSSYTKPYVVTVDSPQLVQYSSSSSNPSGLTPNPMTVRVWIDNDYPFADVNNGVPINVNVTLKFAKTTGLSFTSGQGAVEVTDNLGNGSVVAEECTKSAGTVQPAAGINSKIGGAVDFTVQADGNQSGPLPYVVVTSATPGGQKTVKGAITVSATPRLTIPSGATLITCPWVVSDSAWSSVLKTSAFNAYTWDPTQSGYVASTSSLRGHGTWIVSGGLGTVALGGNPTAPSDALSGAGLQTLKSGWNLVGNPYTYPIQLNSIVGVSGSDTNGSYVYSDLVNQGIIGSYFAYWDTDLQQYQYIAGGTATLDPNKGYWVFVYTQEDLIIKWPAVGLNGVGAAVHAADKAIVKPLADVNNWSLQLAALSQGGVDDQNFIGVVSSQADAVAKRSPKAPMSPVQDVSVAINQTINGKSIPMSRAYAVKGAPTTSYDVSVYSKNGGTVTLTWPNIKDAAKNARFRLIDVATGQTRSMNQSSGFTFKADAKSTRMFKVEATTGGVNSAVIGNIVVSRPSRSPGASFTIAYTLSSDATTTVRILSHSGNEIYSVTRGRADRGGQNTVTWNLKDNANRSVAPGTYQVEIVAETATGDRVRRTIPINVIR